MNPEYSHEVASLTINVDSDLVKAIFTAPETWIDPAASYMLYINDVEWTQYAYMFRVLALSVFDVTMKGIPNGETTFRLCFSHPIDPDAVQFRVICLEEQPDVQNPR